MGSHLLSIRSRLNFKKPQLLIRFKMVSLWNTRSGGDRVESPRGGHNEDNEGAPRIVVEREPDEHTRLLPQPSTLDGYLSPDDPAVSYKMLNASI